MRHEEGPAHERSLLHRMAVSPLRWLLGLSSELEIFRYDLLDYVPLGLSFDERKLEALTTGEYKSFVLSSL